MTIPRTRLKQLKQSDIPILREKLIIEQDGKCLICKREIVGAALDHHHKKRIHGSGKIRGVLCRSCNVFLAKSENNCTRFGFTQKDLPEILRNMAWYLERDHLPYIHPSEIIKRKKLKKSSYNQLVKLIGASPRVPAYPASQYLTKPLERLFMRHELEPEFYK